MGWIRKLFERGAESIDPEEADVRAVGPADPPEIVVQEIPPGQALPHLEGHSGPTARELRSEDRGQR